MGIFSWLFKEEEQPKKQPEKKPETLVFGAELKCPCGFKHSFLIVPLDNLNTNNLPSAHVWDSKAFVNINPFGTCTLGLECEQMIELEDRWENIEPQNVLMGNDEVITMKSTLTCKKSGQWIVPVNSGQDGQAAARILREAQLTYEMEQKYPGLLDILKDPYGSLYLHEGMCENAIHFLEDSLKRNGDMEMASLYGEYDMEGQLIRSALGHLLVTCDVSRLELFVEGLSTRGVINGMEEVQGWDARILNEEMLEMVRREYPETAERIETKSYYRWQEEHKKALSVLGQMSMELANGLMFYECMIAEKPYLERIERERAYRATKEAGGETAKGSGENGNGETGGAATGESEGGARTQTINNKFPNDNQAGRTFDFTVEDGKILIENGIQEVDFVIDMDGNLYIGRGHSYLSGGQNVQAVGTMKVNSQGYIRNITNKSGHFQPTVSEAINYPEIFRSSGLNIDNSWIRISEFTTSMSNYVVDEYVFYQGPIQYMPH
ncbi:PAAR-like protein [Lachnospiraceae bacterium 64-25]